MHFAALPPHHGLGSLRVQIFSLFVAVNESLELVVVQAPVFVQITPLLKVINENLDSRKETNLKHNVHFSHIDSLVGRHPFKFLLAHKSISILVKDSKIKEYFGKDSFLTKTTT